MATEREIREARQLLGNKLLQDILDAQQRDAVDRFIQAESDDVPKLVACNIESKALERLKECINDECTRIIGPEDSAPA